jgi:outer membrane protein TolC
MNKFILVFLLTFSVISNAQNSIQFNSIDSVFLYADKNSIQIRTGDEQSILAKWTLIVADANVFNIRNNISFAGNNNIQLPVSYIPADLLGGPPGTYKEITLGQQFVSTLSIAPQIDLINPAAWAKIKSAKSNKALTEINNLISKKNLFESIAACYYNIVAMKEEVVAAEQNRKNADSLFAVVKNKYAEGIARSQDVNNASANQLNILDKLNQLNFSLGQQLNNLKLLCDIPLQTAISISENPDLIKIPDGTLKASGTLMVSQTAFQEQYARAELRSNRMSFLPALSLIAGFNWQQNSNDRFFDDKAKWVPAQFIGFKISVPLPADVGRYSQSYTSKINYKISKLNAEHSTLMEEVNNDQLEMDQGKALSTFETAQQIYELKKDNYEKSNAQYKEGILSTDLLITAYNDLLSSQLNMLGAKASLLFSAARIKINNTIK